MGEWKGWERRNRKTWEHLLKWKRLSKAEGVRTGPDQYQVMHEHMEGLVTLAYVIYIRVTWREEDTTKENCLSIIIIRKGCGGSNDLTTEHLEIKLSGPNKLTAAQLCTNRYSPVKAGNKLIEVSSPASPLHTHTLPQESETETKEYVRFNDLLIMHANVLSRVGGCA